MEEDIINPEGQQGATAPDKDEGDPYWNVFNAFGVVYQNPELRFQSKDDTYGEIDYEDTNWKTAYDAADTDTKRNMIEANNLSDALKISERTRIFKESQKAIEDDSLLTMLSHGALPAVASPSSIIPGGAILKGAALANKVGRIGSFTVGGALGGAAAGFVDEALFDAQGMPTNYLGAAGVGAIFGGGLGMLAGLLSGPYSKAVANAIHPENDTYFKHFDSDPFINTRLDDEGNIIFQDPMAMDKNLVDKVPFLGDILRSDVHTGLQSSNKYIRQFMLRISPATTASRDASGNLMPVNKTGMDKSRQMDGYLLRLNQDISEGYSEALLSKEFKGSRAEFVQAVYRSYIEESSRQRKAAVAHANMETQYLPKEDKAAFKQAYDDALEEFYVSTPHEFTRFAKVSENFKKFYNNMLDEGQAVNLTGLGKSKSNRLYAPRLYNYKAIKNGSISAEQAKSEIRAGLVNDGRNNLKTAEALEESVERIYKMLQEGEFNTHITSSNFKMDADLPFDSRLQNRKWFLDEAYMPNLVMDNFEDISGAYHYGMKGRISTKYAFGEEQVSEIIDVVRQRSIEEGLEVLDKDINALKRSIEDMQGQLRINNMSDTPAWTWSRNTATFNSVTKGGGFGVTQAIETAGVILMNGVDNILSGHLKHSLAESRKLLYQGGKDSDEFANFLIDSGFMGTTLHSHRVNRFADGESGFNSGILENSLNGMSDGLQKWNTMRYFMGVMEDFTGASVGRKIMTGKATDLELTSWGLNKQQADALGARLREVTNDTTWDLHKLSAEEADLFQFAISRGIQQLVVQGDSIHAPAWFKTLGPLGRLLFQFMRFPLVAQEILTRRGFKEAQAQMVAGMVGSSIMFMVLNSLREEAAVSLGLKHEVDREFDIFNKKEDMERALLKSLNYNAPLGFMTSVWNYGAIATGQPELGRDWQGKNGMMSLIGPTGGMGEDLIQIIRAGVEGRLTDERTLNRFKNLTPFLNAPILSEGVKALTEEYGR